METAAVMRGLVREVVRLLRARWAVMTTWFCLGWAAHEGCLFVSALLGVGHPVLANLVFVVGVIARIVSLVLMLHGLEPALGFHGRVRTRNDRLRVPDSVFATESGWQAAALGVGPFLAVYAVWGLVDDEVRNLFVSNYTVLGLGDVTHWSISLDPARWRIYLGLAVAGWLVRRGVEMVRERRSWRLLDPAAILAEGIWTFASFVLVVMAAKVVGAWWQTRVIRVELSAGWRSFLSALPDWRLLFGRTLADLLAGAATVLPGATATVLLLPLMWLALAATVFGWHEVRADDVVAGTRIEGRVRRLSATRRDPLTWLARQATGDLRTKYLPVAQAFRLILAAGPRFVGCYLVLATVVSSLQQLATIGLTVAVGVHTMAVGLLLDPLQRLLVDLPVTLLAVALYAAGFDRAMVAVSARPEQVQPEEVEPNSEDGGENRAGGRPDPVLSAGDR